MRNLFQITGRRLTLKTDDWIIFIDERYGRPLPLHSIMSTAVVDRTAEISQGPKNDHLIAKFCMIVNTFFLEHDPFSLSNINSML